jgi:lipopolysaccharide export system permease protein
VWLKTVGCRWDLVVDLRNTAASRLIVARARWRHRRTPGDRHRVEEAAGLLARAIGFAGPPPAPRLWLGGEALAAGARLVPAGGPVLAVAPGSTHWHKQWPVARFIDLVGRLTGPGAVLAGARVAVVGSPAERREVEAVLASVAAARRIDLAGPDPIDHIAAALARCGLFIGNDGGSMHMAAAVGIPTLGLFGPTPASVYRPWGARGAAVLCAEPYPALRARLEAGLAAGTEDEMCLMESLAVDAVEAAALDLLAGCGQGGMA